MEIRSLGADLFMGQMEKQTEGQRNMMKLKATYRNFLNSPVREEYQLCDGVEACLLSLLVKIQISDYKER